MSRTWFKIHADRWLEGTIRDETPEVRGIFVDLLALASSGRFGDTGEVKITARVGFSDANLAQLLGVTRQKWAYIKGVLLRSDRIMVNENNSIHITNWHKYQSEYERQKPYREKGRKLQPELQPEVTSGVTQEKEIEIEIEIEIEDNQGSKKTPDFHNENRRKVFEELEKRRGYNSPVAGKEAKAITWMLKQGYTVEQIMGCHDKMGLDKFWQGKMLDMVNVQKQIGEYVKEGKDGVPGGTVSEAAGWDKLAGEPED